MSLFHQGHLRTSSWSISHQYFLATICTSCKGKAKIIAAIEDQKVINKILTHLGLSALAPKLHPARGPPDSIQDDIFEPQHAVAVHLRVATQPFFEN